MTESKSTNSSHGFFAECYKCNNLGFVSIPSTLLDESLIKRFREVEYTTGLGFECESCSAIIIDIMAEESGIDNIPNWIDILEKDGKRVFVSKKRSTVDMSNQKMSYTEYLIEHRGFKRVR